MEICRYDRRGTYFPSFYSIPGGEIDYIYTVLQSVLSHIGRSPIKKEKKKGFFWMHDTAHFNFGEYAYGNYDYFFLFSF